MAPNDFVELDANSLAALLKPPPAPTGLSAPNGSHPRDHNSAGAPLAELLVEETADLACRRDELLGSVSRVPDISDEPTNKKAADLVRLIAACRKTAETQRVSRKDPYLAAERLIDATYKMITDPLDKAKAEVEKKMTAYQRRVAEDERRRREDEARAAAEEARRLAAEAAAREAAAATIEEIDEAITTGALADQAFGDAIQAQKAAEAKPADLARTRGDFGAISSLRRFWDFTDLDRDTLDLLRLRAHIPLDALEKAVRAYIRAGGRNCAGVTIFENTGVSVR